MRKKLKFEMTFLRHRWPLFAVGFVSGSEFVVSLWLVDFRVSWGY